MSWGLPISAKVGEAAVATFPFWIVLSTYEGYGIPSQVILERYSI